MSDIIAVYTDGGIIGKNPSPLGGTWAFCYVNKNGERNEEHSGLLLPYGKGDIPQTPHRVHSDTVTNNQTEYYAILQALSYLPDGWSGTLYTDSKITLGRVWQRWKCTNIPYEWQTAVVFEKKRLGRIRPFLLKGHPTTQGLAREEVNETRGIPPKFSIHNVACDEACTRMACLYLLEHQKKPALALSHPGL